jgi:hypothetical protein
MLPSVYDRYRHDRYKICFREGEELEWEQELRMRKALEHIHPDLSRSSLLPDLGELHGEKGIP